MNKLKQQIIKSVAAVGEGHIPSAFSILDILWVLYNRVLNIDPADPKNINRDRFVLSKGHSSVGLYAVLADRGFFDRKALEDFAKFDSFLGGHPDRNKVPGVEASTGSLGHGFPMAVGMALGLKINKNAARVFTLIGDGEANEGTVWESALLAAHHHLDNLYCIVDHNHSTDRALLVDNLVKKFESFGWETIMVDGHDQEAIYKALSSASLFGRPKAIVAATIKGRGIKAMENNASWHHRAPNTAEADQFLLELE